MTHDVTVVWTDGDWEGLYINSDCVWQGHQIPAYEALEILQKRNIGEFVLHQVWTDSAWMENRGHLPDRLENVVLEGN